MENEELENQETLDQESEQIQEEETEENEVDPIDYTTYLQDIIDIGFGCLGKNRTVACIALQRLSEEDKALAKKSADARKKNYTQLRKDKKVVWHGKLQGKLLADVLEGDLMEVI